MYDYDSAGVVSETISRVSTVVGQAAGVGWGWVGCPFAWW